MNSTSAGPLVDDPPVATSDPAPGEVGPPSSEGDHGSLGLLLTMMAVIVLFGVFVNWILPAIIGGLVFMLFMHELGHYVTARASGMQVTEFFLGFGPKIWSFQRGETEYGLKSIPAGAYVRITGMTNLDPVAPSLEHRTYRSQPYWQRMVTICAGSAMHFLMALVALVVMFASFAYPGIHGFPWEVDRVVDGSTAERIGIQSGDQIREINGTKTRSWDEFGDVVADLRVAPISVTIERQGEELVLEGVMGARSEDVVGAGFGLVVDDPFANQGWTVDAITPDSNADQLGFEVGDRILSIGGMATPSQSELAVLLFEADGTPLSISVERGTSETDLSGTIRLDRSREFRGFFGVGFATLPIEDPTFGESIGLAASDFRSIVWQNLVGLKDLPSNIMGNLFGDETPTVESTGSSPVTGPASGSDEESGGRPISMVGIGRLFYDAESTLEVLFLFMVVNIFIGIFNLLPLLPLDGGHAAVATYERVREVVTRRPYRVDASRLIPFTWAVLILLVMLGLWAAFLDIFSWPT